jgi:hypothetical protein
MKMRTRTALALSGGAAALVLAVGGGVMTAPPAHQPLPPDPTTLPHPVLAVGGGVMPAPPAHQPLPPDPSTLPHPAGTGVHIASLTGCIGGLNC